MSKGVSHQLQAVRAVKMLKMDMKIAALEVCSALVNMGFSSRKPRGRGFAQLDSACRSS